MKILQVISYFYPAWSYGGPGKLVYDLGNKLASFGNSVTVLTTDAYSQYQRRSEIEIHRSKNLYIKVINNFSNYLAYHYKFFTPVGSLSILKKSIKNYDLVHIHEFFTLSAVVVAFYSNKFSIPYLVSAHGTLDNFHLRHRSLSKKIFMLLFGYKIIKNSSGFIAATDEEIQEYQNLGIKKEKIYLVQNGIDFSEFKSLPPRGKFRKKNNINDNVKLIIYLGRIHKLKGLSLLLQAFEKLKRRLNCKLVIAGSNDGFLPELKKQAEKRGILDKVIFTGIISGKNKLEAYSDSDVFVYPSPSEGFSLAILEAAAANLPLVITKGCKFQDVEKYKAGIIVSANSSEIYKALKKILTDKNLLKLSALNARRLIEKKFTISKMAEKLENIYKSLTIND